MKNILSLIVNVDRALSITREHWMHAPECDKAHWMRKIDGFLDERLRLMAVRDEQYGNAA